MSAKSISAKAQDDKSEGAQNFWIAIQSKEVRFKVFKAKKPFVNCRIHSLQKVQFSSKTFS